MQYKHKQCKRTHTLTISVLFITLFMFFSCKGYKYVQLNVSNEGELAERLTDFSNSVTDISISGKLNDKDIQQLIELATGSDLLTRIDLTNCSVNLPHHAFAGCSFLKSIALPSNDLKEVSKHTFSGCSSLESIVIPEGCTTIKEYAFSNCTKLKEIILPESMETIGSEVFKNCKDLSTIKCFATTPPNCSSAIFNDTDASCVLIVPKGCASLYKNAIGWEKIKKIEETKNSKYVGPTQWGKN